MATPLCGNTPKPENVAGGQSRIRMSGKTFAGNSMVMAPGATSA